MSSRLQALVVVAKDWSTHTQKGHCANYFAFSIAAIWGGRVKISCLAVNEICCSITDWFCFVGTPVISSSGIQGTEARSQRSNLTRSQPILRPQRTAPSPLANYKNIRDPCFNVGRQFSRRQVAVGMLEALGPSWSGLHLLKLSLKCFAMIKQGGSVEDKGERSWH